MIADLELLLQDARAVGCPVDQMENFLAAGYVPQRTQMQFHAAAREADVKGGPDQILFGGARGGGKSHAVMAQLVFDDCMRVAGLKGLYLRKAQKQAREQFEDLRRDVLGDFPHEYKRGSSMVELPNGSRLMIGHFRDEKDVDAYLGIQYDVVAVEELTTLSGSKYQALRDSNRTSKMGWRPRIYASTNPGSIGHSWVKNRFVKPYRDGVQKWTRYIPSTIDDNAFIDDGYRRKIEENTGWRLRAYRYGDWDIAIGQFFTTWREDVHVIKPFDITKLVRAGWPCWASMDYGYTHPSAFLVYIQDPDSYHRIVVAEYGRSRMLPPAHTKNVFALLARLGISPEMVNPWVCGKDAFAKRGDSSGLTVAEQYAANEIYFEPADMDRINGWARVLEMLGDYEADPVIPTRLEVFNTCKRLIEQIPSMVHNPNIPEDVLKVDVDEDGMGGDDYVDSLRYGMMAKNVGAEASALVEAPDMVNVYDGSPWIQRTEYDDTPWGGGEIEYL